MIHHTIDKIPDKKDLQNINGKKHLENQTAPIKALLKIRKDNLKKKEETWK